MAHEVIIVIIGAEGGEMPRQAQIKTRRNDSQVPKRAPKETNRRSVEDQKDIRDARRALKEARKKGSVAWEQVKREVGI